MTDFKEIAKQSRLKCLELVFKAQTSHIGSLFSVADIMAVLFEKIDLKKDFLVLSAGWKACMLYYHMWRKSMITDDELNSYCMPGSKWIGLSEPVHPFIKFAGGSMGMGLPAAVGFALGKKLKGEEGMIFCLMSDGEISIGTTHESAQIALHHGLDNLIVIIDGNGFQAMGKTEDILDYNLGVFNGWDFLRINGHRYASIENAIDWSGKKPLCIFAETTKGKGVSFFENDNLYHYKQLSEEEYGRACKELRQS